MDGSGRKAIICPSNKHRELGENLEKARKGRMPVLGKERYDEGCAGCMEVEDKSLKWSDGLTKMKKCDYGWVQEPE